MIKGNGGTDGSGKKFYPDNALIENNSFYNTKVRHTSNPVTFIDVVGPDNWIIRGNFIADFQKGEGDTISYGAFVKGNASGTIFESNLVIGEYRHTGGVRVGLSLGGAITLSSQAIMFVIQMGSTMILARILSPQDYGINAMAVAITGFAGMFTSLGLSAATIQRADITHEQVSTLFWINTAIGLLITLITAAISPAAALEIQRYAVNGLAVFWPAVRWFWNCLCILKFWWGRIRKFLPVKPLLHGIKRRIYEL